MNAIDFLLEVNALCCGFHTNERGYTKATNSELRRWLQMGAVVINGVRPKPFDVIEFPVTSMVLFPKGARKCTLL